MKLLDLSPLAYKHGKPRQGHRRLILVNAQNYLLPNLNCVVIQSF